MAVLRVQGDFLSVILMIFLKKWFFIWNRGLRPSMDRKSLQESEFHCKNTRGAPYDLEIWKIMKNITRHPRLHMNTPGPNEKIFPDRWIEYMDVSGPHPAPRFRWALISWPVHHLDLPARQERDVSVILVAWLQTGSIWELRIETIDMKIWFLGSKVQHKEIRRPAKGALREFRASQRGAAGFAYTGVRC